MNRTSLFTGLAGALGILGIAVSAPAHATEAVPAAIAQALDSQAVDFTMTAAKQRRLMIIENTNRNMAGRRGYGAGPGYGPRSGYGPGPGYGPRSGYGRDYGRRDGYRRGYGY